MDLFSTIYIYCLPWPHHLYSSNRPAGNRSFWETTQSSSVPHPPGLLRTLIQGSMWRLQTLCTSPTCHQENFKLFVTQLLRCGYNHTVITKIVANLTSNHLMPTTPTLSSPNNLFLHVDFTPANNLCLLHHIFYWTIEAPQGDAHLSTLRNKNGNLLDAYHLIIAYHPFPNLRNIAWCLSLDHRLPPFSKPSQHSLPLQISVTNLYDWNAKLCRLKVFLFLKWLFHNKSSKSSSVCPN
jgi:hypothetical protein